MSSFEGLGRALRWVRLRQGKKQYEVADEARITKAMLSSYENERQRPTIETLERILDALGIDLDDLAFAMRQVLEREEAEERGETPGTGPGTLEAQERRWASGPETGLRGLVGGDLDPSDEQALAQVVRGLYALVRQRPGSEPETDLDGTDRDPEADGS